MKKRDKVPVLHRIEPYMWLAPSLILFGIFTFYPFITTFIKSFFILDTRGNYSQFVGLENYTKILGDETFLRAVKNTIFFVLMTVPVSKILGFLLAILANKRRRFSSFYETAFSLPMAIASSVIAMIFQLLYVPSLGLINTTFHLKIQWLNDPKTALLSIAFVQIWLSTGYAFMFLLSAVRSVPEEILESADMDGAGPLRKMISFYLPLTSPTMFYLVCSDIAFMMMSMGLVNVLTKGGPQNSTITIMYYVFRQFSGSGNYTMANPAAVIAFCMTFVVTGASFLWERRGVHY